jgi:hypothetical protein
METFLGLIGFVVYIVCIIGAAAGLTWLVVKLSPGKKPQDETTPASS